MLKAASVLSIERNPGQSTKRTGPDWRLAQLTCMDGFGCAVHAVSASQAVPGLGATTSNVAPY
jgi:hypothetical protein